MKLVLVLPGDISSDEARMELIELLSISDMLSEVSLEEFVESDPTTDEAWFKLPKCGSQRQAVLLRLLDGETTRDALNDICDGPRVHELVVGGWAAYTEEKIETRRGDQARLVQATEKAYKA